MSDDIARHADAIALRGGHIALDFANTAGWHASAAPSEWLSSYDELIRWSRHVGLHSPAELRQLTQRAAKSHRESERALTRLRQLREAFYRICRAFIAGKSANEKDLVVLQNAYADSLAHGQLTQTDAGFVLAWDQAQVSLDGPVWRLAGALTDFLRSGDLALVRECEGDPCGWLFIDRSKNRSRRWCSSEDCGNRERVRRHLARQ
jgi:predicted RNA-binding Zn ribbon-like protein